MTKENFVVVVHYAKSSSVALKFNHLDSIWILGLKIALA